MRLSGKVTAWINGEKILEDSPNLILDAYKSWLRDIMTNHTDNGININDLFDNYGEVSGGSEDGNDGIAIINDTTGDTETMECSGVSANNSVAFRIRGEYTNEEGSSVDVSDAKMGSGFNSNDNTPFSQMFATYSLDMTLEDLDTLILEWEINFDFESS